MIQLDNETAYNAMFNFLDKYWERTKDSELGGLLGTMSPKLFAGGKPIDPVMHKNWKQIFDKANLSDGKATIDECLNMMRLFIDFQEANFSINLEDLKKILREGASDKEGQIWKDWIYACNQALES